MAFVPVGEQPLIIDSEESALVVAGPGRGKTVTAIAAANRWLDDNPAGYALFTSFSNAAVRRLASTAGLAGLRQSRRLQFRTIHSVALEALKLYGRFVGLRQPARALDKMEERLVASERGWDHDADDYRAHLEAHARDTGHVAFVLMVPWATELLRASATIRRAVSARLPLVIIDEFQDTNTEQWELLKLLGAGSRVIALGDENQMIYSAQFDATLARFADFESWKGIQRTSFSMASLRCTTPEIVEFAEAIVEGRRRTRTGTNLALFPVYRNQVRAKLASLWAAIRRREDEGCSIAFLAPSAQRAEHLADELREPGPGVAVPIPIWAKLEGPEDRTDAFRLAVYAAVDYVVSPSIPTLRRLSTALVTVGSLASRKQTKAETIEKLLTSSRAASPLRAFLQASPAVADIHLFAEQLLSALEADSRFDSAGRSVRRHGVPRVDAIADAGSLFDAYRTNRAPRMEGFVPSSARTSILSMHRCKGREFDYVVMLVDPRAHRQNADLGEMRRLHYVAATRAKRWLGVVYVRNDPGPVLAPVL